MGNMTQKELLYLEDCINMFDHTNKCLNNVTSSTQDAQIKSLCQQLMQNQKNAVYTLSKNLS